MSLAEFRAAWSCRLELHTKRTTTGPGDQPRSREGRAAILHVVIRATLDWQQATNDQLHPEYVREMAARWDSIFRLGFTDCRARIARLAERTHRARSNVRLAPRTGPRSIDLDAVQADDWVLVCDDDDWYSPQLGAALAALNEPPNRRLILWADGRLELYGLGPHLRNPNLPLPLLLRERKADRVRTNNYAISGATLQQNPQLLHRAWFHDEVNRDVIGRVVLPGRALSVVNRHPTSTLVLRTIREQAEASGIDLADAMRVAVWHFAYGPYPAEAAAFTWAAPLIHQTRDLFREALPVRQNRPYEATPRP